MKGLFLLTLLAVTGCWNDNGNTIDLGQVSLGRQLIELKEARDAGAMSAAEYDAVKQAIIDSVVRFSNPQAAEAE